MLAQSTAARRHRLVAACALAAGVTFSAATAQDLVLDINAYAPELNPGSAPGGFMAIGGRLYFAATDLDHGRELWVLEAPATQATLVADIAPGSPASSPANFTPLADGRLLFTANGPGLGNELWVTDGTEAGTVLLADINPGLGSSHSARHTRHGDDVYFFADDGVHGYELWRTDGTTAGTQLAGELEVGAGGADAFFQLGDIASDGTTLVFSGHVDGVGWSVWASDGTVAGTIQLAVLANGTFEPVESIVEAGGQFFFAGRDAWGLELWSSDGTVAGTAPLLDIHPTGDAGPTGLFALAGQVYFAATQPAVGTELWVTDGTPAGTHLVADLAQGGFFFDSSFPEPIGALGNRLVFSASSANTGREPLITDGTQAGTQFLGDLNPLSSSSIATLGPIPSAELGGRLYFVANDGASGPELWSTDGTPAGTALAVDVSPGASPSFIGDLEAFDGRLWFSADDGITGGELFSSDGTPVGTALAQEIFLPATSVGSQPRSLARFGNVVIFGADDGVHGIEPWTTDGTAAGTALFADLMPGPASSDATSFIPVGDWCLFLARTPEYGFEPWRTDGTPEGTFLLHDFFAGPIDSFWSAIEATIFEGRAYFSAFSQTGNAYWVTDGTVAGTVPFFGDAGTFATFVGATTVHDGWLYFAASDGASGLGTELYRTAGDPASTELIVDLVPGPASGLAAATELVGVGDHVYFAASDGTTGQELWRSDGTAAGTTLVVDLLPGSESSSPRELTVLGDRLLFEARDAADFFQVYATDGTAAGTVELTDAAIGVLLGLDAGADVAFFRQKPSGLGAQLWTTDGTVAGTTFVETLSPATFGANAFEFERIASGPTMLFPNSDGLLGTELWSTDGSAAGTDVLFDLAPGGATSFPGEFVRLGDRFLFVGNDGQTGAELHVASLTVMDEWVSENYGQPCGAGAPDLTTSAEPRVGEPFDVAVSGAVPGLIGALAIGTLQAHDPLVGECELLVAQPFAVLASFVTDAGGGYAFPVLLGPAFAGLNFQAQAVVLDGTGLHASAGLEVVLAP